MNQQEAAHLQSQKAKELAQWATEQYQKELLEVLQKEKFPADEIPYNMAVFTVFAIIHESPNSLNCTIETFENIATKEPCELNMQEFEISIAMMKTKTMHQLEWGDEIKEYIDFQKILDRLAKRWVEITQEIAKPIEDRIETSRKEQLDAYIAELRKKSVMDELQGNGAKRIPLGTA